MITPVETADITVLLLTLDDPQVRPLLDELAVEYEARYADLFGAGNAAAELNKYPAAEFAAPDGAVIILQENGQSIAGGAFRRYSPDTAEFKRIWTHSQHRRRGLARQVLAELESKAVELGYSHVYLTTGPRQPEARGLYLSTNYTALFDLEVPSESLPFLAFSKDLARN